MPNVLTVPVSGAIYFDNSTAGGSTVPNLTSAVVLDYDGGAGLNITSYNTSLTATDRFTVDGANGRLFSVSDALTGTIFSVNDAAGLPIIEVNSGVTDVVTMGTYGTNALVISGGNVGIGTATPGSAKLTVAGSISSNGGLSAANIVSNTATFDSGRVVISDYLARFDSINVGSSNSLWYKINVNELFVSNSKPINFGSGVGVASDISLIRDGGTALAQRNSTNPQEFRLYNTYTDASNYQRGTFTWLSGGLVLGTQSATTAGVSALSALVNPIILAPGYNQSLSATAPVILQQTWNNSTNTFTLLSANVTDNASGASSLLMDLRVGGASKLSLRKDGRLQFGSINRTNISVTNAAFVFSRDDGQVGEVLAITANSNIAQFIVKNSGQIGFSSAATNLVDNAPDVVLLRDAANTLAQRNSTAPQESRIYTTYTDANNNEYFFTKTNVGATSATQIGLSARGTGQNRNLEFVTGGSTRMTLASAGRVGIGTTSPSTNLEITTTNNGDGIKLQRSDGERSAWLVDDGTGNGALYLFNGSNSNTGYIVGNGNSYLNGGNLGIGTSSPNQKLTVSGNISASGNITSNTSYVVSMALSADVTANNATDTPLIFPMIKADPSGWTSVNGSNTRITPTVPGYYNVSYMLAWKPGTSGAGAQNNIQILKGATTVSLAQQPIHVSADVNTTQVATALVYMNGTTDYLVFQAYSSNAAQVIVGDSNWSKVELFKIN